VRTAVGAEDMAAVRALFREYQRWLDVEACFAGFEAELATLPGAYAPPHGGIWLAVAGPTVAGAVGLRPLDDRRGEMKRLWVRPACRGRGGGRRLALACIAGARAAGYRELCLETLERMAAARALYAALGFRPALPFGEVVADDICYMTLDLTSFSRSKTPQLQP